MPEPTSDTPVALDRRFVILEHRWNGVHWDFMVEDGPTLRTWAIDAVIVAGTDLPARPLAPHRRDYLDYEGPVAGGRGDVRRWDQGVARVEVWGDRLIRLRVAGRQLVGLVEVSEEEGEMIADAPRWRFRFGKLS